VKAAIFLGAVIVLGTAFILWALSHRRAAPEPAVPPAPARPQQAPDDTRPAPTPAATPESVEEVPVPQTPATVFTPPPAKPSPAHAAQPAKPGPYTVADRLTQYGEAARARWEPAFSAGGMAYPPRKVAFIGLKDERVLEVWAAAEDGLWCHVRDYPILGMSGALGPKLREGDGQAPEGLYRIESLNPNSAYHLSLRIDYPNAHDRKRGIEDGRASLGSDIMIHGKSVSIGCLAMGDQAAEDLFVLAADTGMEGIPVILSPVDFRARELPDDMPPAPRWIAELYGEIRTALRDFVPATGPLPLSSPPPGT
jgi:hypothetical protein